MRFRIGTRCGEEWSAMAPVAGGRHCARCDRDVVDLTRLTRRQARDEVRARDGRLCIRMAVDARGEPLFRSEPRRVGPAGALALAGALLGCEAAEEPRAIEATVQEEIPADAEPAPMLPLATTPAPTLALAPMPASASVPMPMPAPASVPTAELDPSAPTPEQRALTRRKRRQIAAAAAALAAPPPPSQIWMGDYID